MSATLEDLNAKVAELVEASAADAAQDLLVIAAIEALIAKITNSPAAPDFAKQVADVQAVISGMQSSNTAVQAELDKAAPLE